MVRLTGAELMMQNIRNTQNAYLKMSVEDRIKFIESYKVLYPYQKTALLQLRKFMSPAEKRALKKMTDLAKQSSEEPQPNQ